MCNYSTQENIGFQNGVEVEKEIEWRTVYLPKRVMERQMVFYSAISKGEKPVVYATFWTRVKGWFGK